MREFLLASLSSFSLPDTVLRRLGPNHSLPEGRPWEGSSPSTHPRPLIPVLSHLQSPPTQVPYEMHSQAPVAELDSETQGSESWSFVSDAGPCW